MKALSWLCFTFFCLVGTFFLTAVTVAFRNLRRTASKGEIENLKRSFFYPTIQHQLIEGNRYELTSHALVCTQNIFRFFFAVGALLTVIRHTPHPDYSILDLSFDAWSWIELAMFITLSLFISDYLPRALAGRKPQLTMKVCGSVASLLMLLLLPFLFPFLTFFQYLSVGRTKERHGESISQAKDRLLEVIDDSCVKLGLDAHDQKLIESSVNFHYRIAREIMVPRVNLFALEATTTIREAARLLESEGYSRTPVYREDIDDMIGILMYHDLLSIYREAEESKNPALLDVNIEGIAREVFYTPETKKISDLLEEFRKNQMHLAIVVDEYGGTEGIITIEDILEEIVGNISDEYDTEELLFTHQSDGSWIVNARMNIFDIEEEIDIKIPPSEDYDTVGGYIFHKVGAIPPPGLVIHHDRFDIEILSSTDRKIDKIKITPVIRFTEGEEKKPS